MLLQPLSSVGVAPSFPEIFETLPLLGDLSEAPCVAPSRDTKFPAVETLGYVGLWVSKRE